MRLRSFFGLLLTVAVAFGASYLARFNSELLEQRFQIGPEGSIPLWVALLVVFLIGFLPVGVTLVVDTLRHELAKRRGRRRRREDESLEATLRRAVDLRADGQLVPSAHELEAYLAGRPDCFQGLLLYGLVLRGAGRLAEAIEVHRRASNLFPQSVAVLYELAEDYAAKGESEVARELRGRIERDFSGYGLAVMRRLRSAAIAQRDWSEAGRQHERIVQLLSTNGDTAALARESNMGQGIDYQTGVLALEQDQLDEATDRFRSLLAQEPRFLPARIMLGEAELLAGREDDAVAAWRNGYLESGSPVFLQRIEDHFIEDSEPLRAIETLRGLISEAENDLLPRFYLGRLYYRLEMLDEAARVLSGLTDRIKSSPTYHFLLARIHERRGNLDAAVGAYLACLRELDLGSAEFVCRICSSRYGDWRDFCEHCQSWNSIELNFEEERLSAEDLGVHPVLVWGPPEDSGEIAIAALPGAPEG